MYYRNHRLLERKYYHYKTKDELIILIKFEMNYVYFLSDKARTRYPNIFRKLKMKDDISLVKGHALLKLLESTPGIRWKTKEYIDHES